MIKPVHNFEVAVLSIEGCGVSTTEAPKPPKSRRQRRSGGGNRRKHPSLQADYRSLGKGRRTFPRDIPAGRSTRTQYNNYCCVYTAQDSASDMYAQCHWWRHGSGSVHHSSVSTLQRPIGQSQGQSRSRLPAYGRSKAFTKRRKWTELNWSEMISQLHLFTGVARNLFCEQGTPEAFPWLSFLFFSSFSSPFFLHSSPHKQCI